MSIQFSALSDMQADILIIQKTSHHFTLKLVKKIVLFTFFLKEKVLNGRAKSQHHRLIFSVHYCFLLLNQI